MRFHTVPAFLVMSVLFVLSATARSGEDAYRLTQLGGEMNAKDKASLEEQVAKKPNDVESRTKLLGYYFIKGRQDADAKSATQRHVVWLIENAPESQVLGLPYGQIHQNRNPEGYRLAREAWLAVLKKSPENLSVLWNASSFFLLEDQKLSEELLLKGQGLDAKDARWPASLGQIHSLKLISLPAGPMRKTTAEKAFRQYKLAYDLSGAMEGEAILSDLAKAAIESGLIDEAKKYATQMLDGDKDGWNHGNHVHHGNLILGRIALLDGKVDEAKSRLLLAGKTEGSPQLSSFGPNMLLAKELLERGETKVVLDYFELCKKFWDSRRKLETWGEDVKANRTPDFGANLDY